MRLPQYVLSTFVLLLRLCFMTHGDWRLLVFRPLCLALLLIGFLVLVGPPLVAVLRRRRGVALAGA